MPLAEIQQRVDQWVDRYQIGYFHPLTNIARLAEEVGELSREVNHQFGQKTKKGESGGPRRPKTSRYSQGLGAASSSASRER